MKINDIVWDDDAKELVKLTNGTDAGGVFVPTEAMAMRVLDINKKGRPVIGFTYRRVRAAMVRDVPEINAGSAGSVFDQLDKADKTLYVGRI